MSSIIRFLALFFVIFTFIGKAESPKVVSSIYPIQQITNIIAGEPTQLLANTHLSPHSYKTTPRDVEVIIQADLFIWIGDVMLPKIHRLVKKRQKNEKPVITLSELSHIKLLKADKNHDHSKHDHSKHDHSKHDHSKHDHSKHDHSKHDHSKHDHSKHDHSKHDHDKHNHTTAHSYDPHLWLSPKNAKVIAKAISDKLQLIDAKHASKYQANYQNFAKQLDKSTKKIKAKLKAQPLLPFYTFHNAYQYFEKSFDVKSEGEIKSNPQQAIKTKSFIQLTNKLKQFNSVCVFSEPQFTPPILKKLSRLPNVKTASLDPVGYNKENLSKVSIDGYINILKNLANTLVKCQ